MSVLGQTVFVCYETKQKKEQEWQENADGEWQRPSGAPADAEWLARQEGIQREWENGRLARQKERRKKKRADEGHDKRKKKRAGDKFFKEEAQKAAEAGSTEPVDSNLGVDTEAAAKKAKKRLAKR